MNDRFRRAAAGWGKSSRSFGSRIGWEHWTVGRFHISTDDAYVKTDNTTISPKVSGYIGEVRVGDNEQVKSGQGSRPDR